MSLRAFLLFSLVATGSAKPQSHTSAPMTAQLSPVEADASLFERYVASHLRSYHHSHVADVTSPAHSSHLSTLLQNAHNFVVSGRSASKERSVKMAHRANALALKAPSPADRRDVASPGLVSEKRLGKVSSAHGSRTVWHVVKRSFDDDPDEDDVTAGTEETWTWMDVADDKDADNGGVDEKARAYSAAKEEAARSRMVVRTKRPAAEPLAVV